MEEALKIFTVTAASIFSLGAVWSSHKEDYARAAWRIGFACFMLLAHTA